MCITVAWGRMHVILRKIKLADVYNRCQGPDTPCIAVAKGLVHNVLWRCKSTSEIYVELLPGASYIYQVRLTFESVWA